MELLVIDLIAYISIVILFFPFGCYLVDLNPDSKEERAQDDEYFKSV